jgi:Zn-dependent peptidase ImmA (M78 family)
VAERAAVRDEASAQADRIDLARRLLTLGLASQRFYEKRRRELEESWKEYQERKKKEGKSGAPPFHRMLLRKHGKPFVRTVLSAYYGDHITLSDVCDYLDVKVKYLKKEREVYVASYGAA